MKTKNKVILTVVVIVSLIVANGFYYVFVGQFKSQEKLDREEELTLYECCSIYTMHMAMWMFGWPLAPEAAAECFRLHFKQKEYVYPKHLHSGYRMLSPKLVASFRRLESMPDKSSIRVAWNGVEDYALLSKEHRAAIAVNPCVLIKDTERFEVDKIDYFLESKMIYPKKSVTPFNLGKITIIINEGLFRYLQDKGWLSKYTMVYPYGDAMFSCKERSWD